MSFLSFIYALIMAIINAFSPFSGGEQTLTPIDSYRLELDDGGVLSVSADGADSVHVFDVSTHVLHMGVVGRFGTPVEVTADEFDGATLTFTYDEAALGPIPAENLLVLWYDENRDQYIEREPRLDTLSHTVSLDITTGGVYLLVDRYEWLRVWGVDVEEYAHDIVFTNSEYTPEFRITVPKFIPLSGAARDSGERSDGTSYVQLCGNTGRVDISYSLSYNKGENVWQNEYDGWTQQIAYPMDNTTVKRLEYSLADGAQAYLYRWDYDDSSRGGPVSTSLLLHVKVSNDEYISVSIGLDPEADGFDALLDTCIDYLGTFEWVGVPSEEAYMPAKEFVPQQPAGDNVSLVAFTYDAAQPAFNMLLPDCVTPNPQRMNSLYATEYDFEKGWLMFCNQSDDIYYDLYYYKGEDMWSKRLLTEEFIFNIEGLSYTVEDISADIGCPAEIYVLRFADTGKPESEHLSIYVFGFYGISDTEMVSIRCDLWADVEDEYMDIINESLRSVRFLN